MDNQEGKKEVVAPVKINKATLTAQVEAGMKRKALAEHYGLSELKMAEALRSAGLKIRKFHAPKFVFEEDTPEGESTQEKGEVVIDNTVNPPVTGSSEALADKQEQDKQEEVEEAPEKKDVTWD